MLAKNADGTKYVYLDAESFVEVSDEYDFGTSFSGEYAVVGKEGNLFVINKQFEIVSDPLDVESCETLIDGYFVAVIDDKDYIMKVSK